MSTAAETTPRPRLPLAVLAASLPALLAPCTCGLALLTLEHPARTFEDAGPSAFVTLSVAMLAAPILVVLLVLAGTGRRVPAVFAVGLGGAPWVVGLAGTHYVLSLVGAAVPHADPAHRGMMLAGGIAEATTNEVLGASASAALLSATSLALALSALAQPAVRRPLLGMAIGALLALPLLALALVPMVVLGPRAGLHAVLPGLAAVLACAIAGAAAGRDLPGIPPHGRSAALAAAAPIAAGLAYAAGARVAATLGMVEVFAALAHASADAQLELAAMAARELAPAEIFASWGWLAALVPAIAIAGWAASRARPSPGRLVGAVLVALAMFCTIGVGVLARRLAASLLATAAPWPETFQPVTIEEGDRTPPDPHARVEAGRLVSRSGESIPISGPPEALRAFFEARLREPGPTAAFEDLLRPEEVPPDPDTEPSTEPVLALALDARVGGGAIAPLLRAAAAAGARGIALVGSAPLDPADAAVLRERMPLLAALGAPLRSRLVLVAASLPEGYADLDRNLWHGTIRGRGDLVLERRADSGPPRTVGAGPSEDGTDDVAYLAVDPAVDAGVILDAVDRVARDGFRPLLLEGADFPGHPEAPVDDRPIGVSILGSFDLAARAMAGPSVRLGEIDVRGSLTEEAVRRVARRHVLALSGCREEALARSPGATTITLRLVIGTSGAVREARASGSLASPALRECLETEGAGWTFPAGEDVTVAEIPLEFFPDAERE